MKAYIEKLQTEKTPHERRQVALRVASVVTVFIFLGWLATFGTRLSLDTTEVANTQNSAATLQAVQESTPTYSN